MSIQSKLILPGAVLSTFFLSGCGGGVSDAPEEAAGSVIPDEPAAAIETITKELAAGNGGILWEAMPVSYQSDVNKIARLAGSKVDAEIYNKVFELVGRVIEVADKQKEFIFNAQLGGPQSEEEVGKMRTAWPSVVGFLRTLKTSSLASTAGLQAFDGKSFCEETVSELIKYAEDISTISGEELPLSAYNNVVIKALESTETSATLEITAPDGSVETEDFTKVDNRWVPAEMAGEWSTSIANATEQLTAMDPEQMAQNKPQIMGVFTMIDGVLTQIEVAETQEQFDQAIQGAMMPLMGLMMMKQGMVAPSPAPEIPAAPELPVAP
ncbi:MAG: hypothetical protein ACPGGN_02180 [Opitutales bacterium]